MRRMVLMAVVLLNCASFGTELFRSGWSDCESCSHHTAEREYSNGHMSDQL
jgi:hypothetical protein